MENIENFALTEDEYNKYKDLKISSLEELEKFDFTEGTDLEVDKYYDMVEAWKASRDQTDEKKEAVDPIFVMDKE